MWYMSPGNAKEKAKINKYTNLSYISEHSSTETWEQIKYFELNWIKITPYHKYQSSQSSQYFWLY